MSNKLTQILNAALYSNAVAKRQHLETQRRYDFITFIFYVSLILSLVYTGNYFTTLIVGLMFGEDQLSSSRRRFNLKLQTERANSKSRLCAEAIRRSLDVPEFV